MYFAHTSPPTLPTEIPHPLFEHLLSVSQLAEQFASRMNVRDTTFAESARIAGLFHDLGKYGNLFQRRLQGKEKHIDHWSAGAIASITNFRALYSALAIQGHHIGLQNADKNSICASMNITQLIERHPLQLKLSENNVEVLMNRLQMDTDIGSPQNMIASSIPAIEYIPQEFDLRMLFSCLVDADFLDTEAHFQRTLEGKQFREQGPILDAQKGFTTLCDYIQRIQAKARSSLEIQRIRNDLWNECLHAAESPVGTWTLSAPTGSGKTLSMLAFALRHAIQNDLQRIIVVIPFLSIIEQTAAIYRQVFGVDETSPFLLEDHSMAGTGAEDRFHNDDQYKSSRLLAENWDAPIIITTHVQFLESLFSNRPFACRKLHNLARSTILFDEVQTLPLDIVLPTLSALSHLSSQYGSSIVFATATQPAFDHLNPHVKEYGKNTEWKPKEIVSSHLNLFARSQRTRVHWPDLEHPISLNHLGEELLQHEQVLCIVNVKRHARELIENLQQQNDRSLFHLSTAMCPAHRTRVLNQIRSLLDEKKPCQLISTQCVEAGVDIDFPVVYRALGPLEAIAQAAGRCNRNGRLASGEVFVFMPESDGKLLYPPGGYEQAASVTRTLLKQYRQTGIDIDDPRIFIEYYQSFYGLRDLKSIHPELKDAILCGDLPDIANQYRVIQQDTINVLVPYREGIEKYRFLRSEAEEKGLSSNWMRQARPLTINLYQNKNLPVPYLIPISYRGDHETNWYFYSEERHYDDRLGLIPEQTDLLLI